MKKILFAASTIEHIKNFHIPYLEELKKTGNEIHVLSNQKFDITYVDNTEITKLQKKNISFTNIREIFSIKKFLEKEKFDLIITHTTLSGFYVRMAVKLLKNKPKVIHIVHGYLFVDKPGLKNYLYLFCEKLVSKVTDKLIVMNEEDLKISRKYKLGKEIHFVNGVGVDLSKFIFNDEKDKKIYRKKFKLNEKDILFLNVAEFSKRKNQKELIYALNKVKNSNIKLVFAGVGTELITCKKLCKKLGLDNRVYFLGYADETDKLYKVCDYYISASKSEGIPFSVIEAASSGLPLLLSNVKGHRDIIKNVGGLVFNTRRDLINKYEAMLIYKRQKNNLLKYDINEVKNQIIDIYIKS